MGSYTDTQLLNGKLMNYRAKWGAQELYRPISVAALKYKASPKIIELARAKKNFQSPDKAPLPRHVIHDIDEPIWKVSENAKIVEASDRVQQLAKPKNTVHDFQEQRVNDGMGRPSCIWPVSKAAMNAEERPHSNELARPKKTHTEYEREKPVTTCVTQSAMKARASARIEQLSRPKSRKSLEPRDSQWIVSPSAKNASPGKRIIELAQAKPLAIGYRVPLEPDRAVNRSALRTAPTKRIEMLAIPIIRRPETTKT